MMKKDSEGPSEMQSRDSRPLPTASKQSRPLSQTSTSSTTTRPVEDGDGGAGVPRLVEVEVGEGERMRKQLQRQEHCSSTADVEKNKLTSCSDTFVEWSPKPSNQRSAEAF